MPPAVRDLHRLERYGLLPGGGGDTIPAVRLSGLEWARHIRRLYEMMRDDPLWASRLTPEQARIIAIIEDRA
jgi:hypothetical protein